MVGWSGGRVVRGSGGRMVRGSGGRGVGWSGGQGVKWLGDQGVREIWRKLKVIRICRFGEHLWMWLLKYID